MKRGWIPVIDMENYPTLYDAGTINGTDNTWEYFYRQPMIGGKRYTLDEVYHSHNVILSNGTRDELYDSSLSKEALDWQCRNSMMIGMNDFTRSYVEDKYNQIIPKGERMIGIIIRGRNQRFRKYGNNVRKRSIMGRVT